VIRVAINLPDTHCDGSKLQSEVGMRRSINSAGILLLFAVATVAGFDARGQEKAKSKGRAKPGSGSQSISKSASKNQINDADCRAYASRVVDAVKAGNMSAVNELVDWDSLFNRTFEGMDIEPKLRERITLGFRNGLSLETGLSGQIIKNSRAGGTFDFLRIRDDESRRVILFRLIQPANAGGVAYFEFTPEKSADGKVRSSDIYVFSSGEFLSAMLRRGVLPVIANENRTFLDKLLTGERDYISDLPTFLKAAQLVSAGQTKEGLELIKGMKAETKKQKAVFLLRLRAAQMFDENEYAATLDEYRKLFPNDPGLDLLSIAYYTTKKDFKQAFECIKRVEAAVGGDPYLNVTRAAICDIQGNHDEAKRLARNAVEAEPTLLPAYFELLGVSLLQKKFDDTLAMLKEIDQKFELKLNDLTTVPQYADFVKSPQYKEWLRYRDQKAKKP
jgi:hypothetical protein